MLFTEFQNQLPEKFVTYSKTKTKKQLHSTTLAAAAAAAVHTDEFALTYKNGFFFFIFLFVTHPAVS